MHWLCHYISCLLVAVVALGKIVTVGKKGSKKKEKEQHAGKKDKYAAGPRELAMHGAEDKTTADAAGDDARRVEMG